MSEISERYRKVAAQFTQRAKAVPDGAWDNAAPCEGWVARDVVGHLVEWLPAFFVGTWGIESRIRGMRSADLAGSGRSATVDHADSTGRYGA